MRFSYLVFGCCLVRVLFAGGIFFLRERLQFGEYRLGADHADDFHADGAVDEINQSGNGLNAIQSSEFGIVIHVHFENYCVAGLSDFIQNRLNELARFAPTGQKTDQHRLHAAQNFRLELWLIDFFGLFGIHFNFFVVLQLV